MSIRNGKHIIGEIDGIRCTIVESAISEERMLFLKDLLLHNKFDVKICKNKVEQDDAIPTYTIGVTDVIFNPVIAVYSCSLHTKEGKVVTPAFWNQNTTIIDSRYWIVRKKSCSKS